MEIYSNLIKAILKPTLYYAQIWLVYNLNDERMLTGLCEIHSVVYRIHNTEAQCKYMFPL